MKTPTDLDKFVIYHNGIIRGAMNRHLMLVQKALSNIKKLKAVYSTRFDIYDAIELETNPAILKSYAQDLTVCEFELQKLWKFPKDERYHRFWAAPKCKCPKMDNEDNYPTGSYIRNMSCVLHGK